MRSSTLLPLALLTALTTARTDLSGCTSSTVVVNGGASIQYYVPGSGEICQFLDCGGGRAPPKTDVPGCLQYSGTASYSPSFLPNFPGGQGGQQVSSTASSTASSIGILYTPPLIITGTSSSSVAGSSVSSSASAAESSSLSSLSSAVSASSSSISSSASSSNSASSSSLASESPASTVTSITMLPAPSSASGSGSGSATSAAASTTSSSGARATLMPQGVLGAVVVGLACIL